MTIQQVVARRLKLFARRRVVSVLDGTYDSIFKGRGVELDSLRQYDFGDSIRDIDWRATARTGSVHTKLYAPLRDQRILVVADTSSSMLLESHTGMNKLDAAYGLIVALGMFVRKNRDLIAVCNGKPDGTVSFSKFSNTNNHIEKLLRSLDGDIHRTLPGKAPVMTTLLQSALHGLRQRGAIFIVTDSIPSAVEIKPLLTKLSAKHQVFWLQLAPSMPFLSAIEPGKQVVDIETAAPINSDLSLSSKLREEWFSYLEEQGKLHAHACRSTGTARGELQTAEQLPEELRMMFTQARRYAKRH